MKLIGLHLIIPKVKSLISIVYSIFTTFYVARREHLEG
jgi:hypothetical protein